MDREGGLFTSQQLIAIAALCIVASGGVGYYWWNTSQPAEPTQEELQALQSAEQRILVSISASAEAATLKDKIPAVTPVTTNPVESMYHNPFE